jgi:hypothetical protein
VNALTFGRGNGSTSKLASAAALLGMVVVTMLASAPSASAHWNGGTCGAPSGTNRWLHAHTRYHYFYDSTSDSDWAPQSREAQLDWNQVLGVDLPSVGSHAEAQVHAFDSAFGDTGWSGVASYPCFHDAKGTDNEYAKYNLTYESNLRNSDRNGDGSPDGVNALQAVACQEIGHMVGGLNHYAGDCMAYGYYSCFPCSVVGDHTKSDIASYFNNPPDGTSGH